MQVFALPAGIDPPDFSDALVDGRYDMNLDDELHKQFFADLKVKLQSMGYTKPLTGEILYFPIADGKAAYMVAEGSKTILIHLPIHDAWSLPDWQLRGLTKTEVKNRVAADKRMAKLFGKKGA